MPGKSQTTTVKMSGCARHGLFVILLANGRSSPSTCSTPVTFQSPATLQHLLLRLAGCSSLAFPARAKLHAAFDAPSGRVEHRTSANVVSAMHKRTKQASSELCLPYYALQVSGVSVSADKWFVIRGNGKKPFCSGEALSPLVSRRRADDLVMP